MGSEGAPDTGKVDSLCASRARESESGTRFARTKKELGGLELLAQGAACRSLTPPGCGVPPLPSWCLLPQPGEGLGRS